MRLESPCIGMYTVHEQRNNSEKYRRTYTNTRIHRVQNRSFYGGGVSVISRKFFSSGQSYKKILNGIIINYSCFRKKNSTVNLIILNIR